MKVRECDICGQLFESEDGRARCWTCFAPSLELIMDSALLMRQALTAIAGGHPTPRVVAGDALFAVDRATRRVRADREKRKNSPQPREGL